jgi:hypothetical protein
MLGTEDTKILPNKLWLAMDHFGHQWLRHASFPSPPQHKGGDPLDAGNPGVQEFNRTTIDEHYLHNLS